MDDTIRAYESKDTEKSLNSNYIEILGKKFIDQESTIATLHRNISTNKNTILYGEGGYGKSQIVKELCNLMKLTLSVVTCFKDMPEAALLGPMHMEKVMKESIFVHNFEASPFMVEGVLVLEEFTSLDSDTANTIRDIIQEKGYRNHDTFIPWKIKAIVAIGNINPAKLATTDEMASLYNDRFVSHINMTWLDHSPTNYIKLMEGNNINVTPEIRFICQLGSKIKASPRSILDAVDLITAHPNDIISILKSMHIFDSLDINQLHILHHEQMDQQVESR